MRTQHLVVGYSITRQTAVSAFPLLGQGGMGAVFKAFDRSLNRFAAIKLLLPYLASSGAARKRFSREAQAAQAAAAVVGVSMPNLSILKTGKAKAIRFSTLNAICRVLDCQPGDILEFQTDGEEESPESETR